MENADLKAQFLNRAAKLRRFNAWEKKHPTSLDGAAAIAALAAIYELIPPACRKRDFDTKHIQAVRQALSHLKNSL